MNIIKRKSGFTLVELLIAVAIFALFLTAVSTVIVDLYRSSRRIVLEEGIYQDMRAMMNQMTQMVDNNAVDYEEYYRVASGVPNYGGNGTYGDYARTFFDFGSDGLAGALCNNGVPPDLNPDCVIDKTTLDNNVGRNPAKDTDGTPDLATAFCAPGFTIDCADLDSLHKQNQLYLINERGDRKTFLGLEPVTKTVEGIDYDENVLSIFWMNGSDTDGNDIVDFWDNGQEFNISDLQNDLINAKAVSSVYNDFQPISPLNTNIVDLKFYVAPLEDPYKAFTETGSDVQMQPHVTIVMTVEPSVTELGDYIGPVPRKTLQTTVFSGVKTNVKSYE